MRAWSENGGEIIATKSLQVDIPRPDLVETEVTTTPPAPIRAPGTTFSVTDTVQNTGVAPSGSSRTRYYLSLVVETNETNNCTPSGTTVTISA